MASAGSFLAVFLPCVCLLVGGVDGLLNVTVSVPQEVAPGDTVTLGCSYDLEGAPLYSAKWYNGRHEFFRYEPDNLPPIKVFSLPGINVDISSSNGNQVVLRDVQAGLAEEYACEVVTDAPLFETMTVTGHMRVVSGVARVEGKEVPLDDVCVSCICEATSGCDASAPEASCDGDTCGLYALPKVYWEDGAKLRVDSSDDSDDEDAAYKACAENTRCAEAIVHNYMIKYAQDCNGDGDIDCYDYAAIHRKGGFGCRATLDQPYSSSINRCIQAAKNLTAPTA